MRKAMSSEKLGRALCKALGIDVTKHMVLDSMIMAEPGSQVIAVIHVCLNEQIMRDIVKDLE